MYLVPKSAPLSRASPATDRFQHRQDAGWAMALPLFLVLFVVALGAVHTESQVVLGIVASAVAFGRLGVQHRKDAAPPLRVGVIGAVAVAFWLASGWTLLPWGSSLVGEPFREHAWGGLATSLREIWREMPMNPRPLALNPHQGLLTWAYQGQLLLVGVAAAVLLGSARRVRRLAKVIVVLSAVVVGVAVVQKATHATTVFGWGDATRAFGPFIYRNAGALFCAMSVPLALALFETEPPGKRTVWAVLGALTIVGLTLSGSRGAWVALAAALWCMAVLRGGRWLQAAWLTLSVGVAAVVLWGPQRAMAAWTLMIRPDFYGDSWSSGRNELHLDALRLIDAVPWTGVGPGGFSDGYRWAKSSSGYVVTNHAHQEVLQLIAEYGLPLGVAFLASVVAGLGFVLLQLRGIRGVDRVWLAALFGSLVAVLTAAWFDFPFRFGAIAYTTMLVAGALLALVTRAQDAGSQRVAYGVSWAARLVFALSLAAVVVAAALREHPSSAYGDAERTIARAEARQTLGDGGALYRQALWQRPLGTDAALRWARLAAASGDRATAAEALRSAAVAYPTSPWPWLNLARLHAAEGDRPAAREAWRRLLALDLPPGLGVRDVLTEAIRADADPLAAAISVVSPGRNLLCTSGLVLESLGEVESAELVLQSAMQEEKSCRLVYAAFLGRRGRGGAGLALLGREQRDCEVSLTRGGIERDMGRPQQARDEFEQAFRQCGSGQASLRFELGRARLVNGEDSGFVMLEALLREGYAESDVHRAIAQAYLARYRYDDALPHLRWLVEHGLATDAERKQLGQSQGH